MKKQYIKPEVNVEEILTVTMLAASGGMDVGDGVYNDDNEVASTTRRGTWGNLWE